MKKLLIFIGWLLLALLEALQAAYGKFWRIIYLLYERPLIYYRPQPRGLVWPDFTSSYQELTGEGLNRLKQYTKGS